MAAPGVGFEDPGRKGLALLGYQPELIDLAGFEVGQVAEVDDIEVDDADRPDAGGRQQLSGSELLPAIPTLHKRLTSDPPARVADVACGVGWAGISIAKAYPGVRVDGFDLDGSSIALAKANAKASGVDDRVTFAVRDAADPAAAAKYDLAIVIEAIHDLSRPVEVLDAIRRMLRPGGSALIADEKTEDTFTAPASEMERMYYGFSIFTCLPAAMTERPTAATGTVMRPDTLRRYAEEAGFGGFEVLPIENDFFRFYRLTP